MRKERRAGAKTLEKILPLLQDLRQIEQLTEKTPGVFYANRSEVLHFHEIDESVVADLFLASDRIRLPVNERSEQLNVLDRIYTSMEHLAVGQQGKQNRHKRGRRETL